MSAVTSFGIAGPKGKEIVRADDALVALQRRDQRDARLAGKIRLGYLGDASGVDVAGERKHLLVGDVLPGDLDHFPRREAVVLADEPDPPPADAAVLVDILEVNLQPHGEAFGVGGRPRVGQRGDLPNHQILRARELNGKQAPDDGERGRQDANRIRGHSWLPCDRAGIPIKPRVWPISSGEFCQKTGTTECRLPERISNVWDLAHAA